jgi:hypothetical protein
VVNTHNLPCTVCMKVVYSIISCEKHSLLPNFRLLIYKVKNSFPLHIYSMKQTFPDFHFPNSNISQKLHVTDRNQWLLSLSPSFLMPLNQLLHLILYITTTTCIQYALKPLTVHFINAHTFPSGCIFLLSLISMFP